VNIALAEILLKKLKGELKRRSNSPNKFVDVVNNVLRLIPRK
jgi:hypothetical protein